MLQLQERLEDAVVLVVVGYEDVINLLRQVGERVARHVARVAVADERVDEDTRARRFNQHARVVEVAHPDTLLRVASRGRRRLRREEGGEQLFVFELYAQQFADSVERLLRLLHAEKLRPLFRAEGDVEVQAAGRLEA